MQDANIEISSTGFKFSYLRFLADGAAGLFMILLCVVGYYADLPVIGQKVTFKGHFSGAIGKEAKIFLLVLAGLLAVPIGLILNATGWFLLGRVQKWGSFFWFSKGGFLARGTREIFHQDLLIRKINLKSHNLYRKAKLYDEFLGMVSPSHLVHVQHIMGLQRFLRSLTIVFMLASIYLFLSHSEPGWLPIAYLAVVLIFSLLLSLLEYYVNMSVVCRTYLLSLENPRSILPLPEESENAAEQGGVQDDSMPDCWDAEMLDRLIRRLKLIAEQSAASKGK